MPKMQICSLKNVAFTKLYLYVYNWFVSSSTFTTSNLCPKNATIYAIYDYSQYNSWFVAQVVVSKSYGAVGRRYNTSSDNRRARSANSLRTVTQNNCKCEILSFLFEDRWYRKCFFIVCRFQNYIQFHFGLTNTNTPIHVFYTTIHHSFRWFSV